MKSDPETMNGGLAAEALQRIAEDMGGRALSPSRDDLAVLERACRGDADRCKRWIKRRLAGEPVAHIVGSFEFRGLTFAIDKRAYITDPEVTHLIDAIVGRVRELRRRLGREPLLAEVGVGCGALALSILNELPEARIVGLELDPDPLALARANATAQGRNGNLRLIESDLFDAWPDDLPPPDLVYADPPWGDATTLYSGDRPAAHYEAMPPASAFPLGGRTGGHMQILRAVERRGWNSELWLNGGVLSPGDLTAAAAGAAECAILTPVPGISILRCRFAPPQGG